MIAVYSFPCVVLCCVVSRYVVFVCCVITTYRSSCLLCRVVSCCVVSYRVLSCCVALHCVVLCCVVLWSVALCCVCVLCDKFVAHLACCVASELRSKLTHFLNKYITKRRPQPLNKKRTDRQRLFFIYKKLCKIYWQSTC